MQLFIKILKSPLTWLVAVGIGLWFFYKYRAATRLRITTGIPSNFSLKGGNLTFTQNMDVQNLDSINLNISTISMICSFVRTKNVNGKIVIDSNTDLGLVTLTNSVNIAANSTTKLPVKVTIPFTNLITAIPDIIGIVQEKTLQLGFNGRISAEGFNIPFDSVFTIKIPKLW